MRHKCRNKFLEFEHTVQGTQSSGTFARISGAEVKTIVVSRAVTIYGWDQWTAIVLPSSGQIQFEYTLKGVYFSCTNRYVATPEGVFKVSSVGGVHA